MTHVELMTVRLHLPGAHSLKEKRARTRGIRDKWGKQAQIAVVESGAQNQWQVAEWSFLLMSLDPKMIDEFSSKIEQDLSSNWDFVVTGVERERL